MILNTFFVKNLNLKILKSQNFVNKVGEIAEKEGHHPDMVWIQNAGENFYAQLKD